MQQILNPQVITQVVLGSTYPPAVTGPDWQRLTGWAIGTLLGLAPNTLSGAMRVPESITKTVGLRLLIEAAWRHPLLPPKCGAA
jgi:hypothetical protein